MKKSFLFTSLLLSINIVFGQADNAAKYANVITAADLKKHLTLIASAEFEGRETGTEGQRKAAAYIEQEFENMGLKSAGSLSGYQQYYPLYQDSMKEARLILNGKEALYGKDFIIPLNLNESGKFRGREFVFAGYGIEDSLYNDYKSLYVKGKIVIIFLGEPKEKGKYIITGTNRASEWSFPGISKKIAVAAAKHAVGILFINANQESFTPRIIENGKKTSLYYPRPGDAVKRVNFAQLSHAFAKEVIGNNFDTLLNMVRANMTIDKEWTQQKLARISYRFIKHRNIINASNVLGIIEGTDKKDEYVFLTGHYDHLGKRDGKIYYGADDDGSGTVAVIQMATAFAKAAAEGIRPRRTLVFMTVSGEEKGLWGSEYYSDHPIFPLDKTTVDLNTDMIGRIDTERMKDDTLNYVYVIGHDKISSDLPLVNEGANNASTKLVLDYKFDDPNDPNRIYFRSDHYNFARKGVPILFFYDGMLKADYHRVTDTVDKISWELYEKRARMIFLTAWEMANREGMLKRDIPLTSAAR